MSGQIGRYRIEEQIARGGMGVVLKAHDPRLSRSVAIKLLLGPLANDESQRRRFQREGKALSRLRHPGIVSLHEVGSDRGRPYLVMDLIDGEPLAERLKREGRLPIPEAIRIALQLAKALHHAHLAGILHRDVTPANVILEPAGGVLLTDFGLAKDIEGSVSGTLTQAGGYMGTPGFWSPEQAQGELELIGPRTDIYGLGATLYAMLTGEPPFTGQSLRALSVAAQLRDPDPPSRVRPQVDRALDTICLRCLETRPADRYPSAEFVAHELKDWGTSGSRRASSLSPLVSGLFVGCLVLSSAGLGWLVAGQKGPAASSPAPVASSPSAPATAASRSPSPRPSEEDEIEQLVNSGLDRYGAQDLLGAMAIFEDVIRRAPRDPRPHSALGAILVQSGRPQEAEQAFSRAIELDLDFVEAWNGRGMCRMARRDFSGAQADFTRAISIDPSYVDALKNRGYLRYLARKTRGALNDIERVLVLEPESVEALLLRGSIRRELGDADGALADLELAAQLDPDHAEVRSQLAVQRGVGGDYEGAIADYGRVIELGAAESNTYHNRGYALEQLDRLEEAADDYARALDLDPSNAGALTKLGLVWVQLRRWGEAIPLLEQALRDAEPGRLAARLQEALELARSHTGSDERQPEDRGDQ